MNKVVGEQDNVNRDIVEKSESRGGAAPTKDDCNEVEPPSTSSSSPKDNQALQKSRHRKHRQSSHQARKTSKKRSKKAKKKKRTNKSSDDHNHSNSDSTVSWSEFYVDGRISATRAKKHLTANAELAIQKKAGSRMNKNIQKLGAAHAPIESPGSIDSDETPRVQPAKASSSESEAYNNTAHGDSSDSSSFSSLEQGQRRPKNQHGDKKDSNHPPTDLEFALGMDSAARKLKRIVKDQKEAVDRKKVDYDQLRELLDNYARDPKTADHDRLNQLLANLGETIKDDDKESESSISKESGSNKRLAGSELITPGSAQTHSGNNRPSASQLESTTEPLLPANEEERNSHHDDSGGVDSLKMEILQACGVNEEPDFVEVPRKPALMRRHENKATTNAHSCVEPKTRTVNTATKEEKVDYTDDDGMEMLKRDILEACGVNQQADFVAVPRKPASLGRQKKEDQSMQTKKSSLPNNENRSEVYPSLDLEGEEQAAGEDALKRDILEACGATQEVDFVAIPLKPPAMVSNRNNLMNAKSRTNDEYVPTLFYGENTRESSEEESSSVALALALTLSDTEEASEKRTKGQDQNLVEIMMEDGMGGVTMQEFLAVPRKPASRPRNINGRGHAVPIKPTHTTLPRRALDETREESKDKGLSRSNNVKEQDESAKPVAFDDSERLRHKGESARRIPGDETQMDDLAEKTPITDNRTRPKLRLSAERVVATNKNKENKTKAHPISFARALKKLRGHMKKKRTPTSK